MQRTQFNHTSQLPVHSFADALRVQVRRRAADGSDTSLGEVTFPRCAEFVAERGAQRGWYALQDPDVTGQSPRRLVSVSSTAPPAPALAPRGAARGALTAGAGAQSRSCRRRDARRMRWRWASTAGYTRCRCTPSTSRRSKATPPPFPY